jgi:hypothetical protein
VNPNEIPVLILAFNRPEMTKILIRALSITRPKQVYFAVDGPRNGNLKDLELVAEVQKMATEFDWPCELHTLFRNENLGLKKAVIEAIDWIFETQEYAVILEDDCHPIPAFFEFCAKNLAKYEHDERVMQISGNCFLPISKENCGSYYFSTINDIWGWATWKRAWKLFERTVPHSNSRDIQKKLNEYFESKQVANWFTRYIAEADSNDSQVWSTQWTLTLINNRGYTIVPQTNLVENVGFNSDATHLVDGAYEKYSIFKPQNIQSDAYPTDVIPNRTLDSRRFQLIKATDLNLRRITLVKKSIRKLALSRLPFPIVNKLKYVKKIFRG